MSSKQAVKMPPTSMSVVVKNSTNKDLTRDDMVTMVKIFPHQAIFRSASYALGSFRQISLQLVELEIRKCELNSADLLSDCVNLQVVCLADNKIKKVPKCLQKLHDLRILNFAHNDISSWQNVSYLFLASDSLTYMNFFGNEICKEKNYRKRIFKLAPSISGLDNYIITDLEALDCTTYFKHLKKHKPCMAINKILISIFPNENSQHAMKAIAARCKAIRNLRVAVSPAGIIQKCFRNWTSNKLDAVKCASFERTIVKFQALVRAFLWRRQLNREIDIIVQEENITAVTMKSFDRVVQINNCVQLIVKWARRCLKKIRSRKNCNKIQRWFRKSIRYHRGVLRWMKRKLVKSLIFSEEHISEIRSLLTAYPSYYVASSCFRNLSCEIKPQSELISVQYFDSNVFRLRKKDEGRSEDQHRCPQIALSLYSLRHADANRKRQFDILKRRGIFYEENRRKLSDSSAPYNESLHHKVFQLEINDKSLLLKVYKYLFLHRKSSRVYFDGVEKIDVCAVDIQRVWRSYIIRKIISPMFLSAVVGRRSVVAVQRWWRNINCLKRRLKLLHDINNMCKSIVTPTVYIDSWVYYHLLRCSDRPPYQIDVMSSFPEFKGIPLFDENGHLAFQPFVSKKRTSSGVIIDLPIATQVKSRACIPQWALWRPKKQLTPTMKSPLSHHVVMFSLLTWHCQVTVKSFDVPFKLSHKLKKLRKIRVVELTFPSVQEAQVRCAMLSLLTYDVKSHSSVELMSEQVLKSRLLEKSDKIINSRALVDNTCINIMNEYTRDDDTINEEERELYPIETQILLCHTQPCWLVDTSQPTNSSRVMQFQFMCECLASRDDLKVAKTARESFQELYQNIDGSKKSSKSSYGDEAVFVNDTNHSPASFIRLEDYHSRDIDATDHHTLPAAMTQQLLGIPKPRVIQDRPKSAIAHQENRGQYSDFRFRDKLWSKERVLLWCSDFHDSAPEHCFRPRQPPTDRPSTARGRMEHHVFNSSAATESRLRMVTLSTTAKTLGKYRFDSIQAPVISPPTISRSDFFAAQAKLKNMDVKKIIKSKKSRENQRIKEQETEYTRKKKIVEKVKGLEAQGAVNRRKWKSEYSAKSKRSVNASLDAAKIASDRHQKTTGERISQTVKKVKYDEASTKIGHDFRKKTISVASTLNTIATKTSKDAWQVKTSRNSENKKLKLRARRSMGRENIAELAQRHFSSEGRQDSTNNIYVAMKQVEKSNKRQQYASSIKDLLLARYRRSSDEQNEHRDGNLDMSDDISENSLSLSSERGKISSLQEEILECYLGSIGHIE